MDSKLDMDYIYNFDINDIECFTFTCTININKNINKYIINLIIEIISDHLQQNLELYCNKSYKTNHDIIKTDTLSKDDNNYNFIFNINIPILINIDLASNIAKYLNLIFNKVLTIVYNITNNDNILLSKYSNFILVKSN